MLLFCDFGAPQGLGVSVSHWLAQLQALLVSRSAQFIYFYGFFMPMRVGRGFRPSAWFPHPVLFHLHSVGQKDDPFGPLMFLAQRGQGRAKISHRWLPVCSGPWVADPLDCED